MDTLGAIVKEISSDGTLKYHKVGGGCWAAIEGENCTVITRKGKKSEEVLYLSMLLLIYMVKQKLPLKEMKKQ